VSKFVWVGAVMACLLVVACSDDDDPTTTPPPSQTFPSSTGDECADPVGDLSLRSEPEPLSEPSGVDIVESVAELVGDDLEVTFTTVGSIASAPSPTFVVGQGVPFEPFSFEVRAVRDDATDNWAVTVFTWPQAEQRRAIAVQPVVTDNTIVFSVPAAELPPLANSLTFGASSRLPGDAGIVIDDCSSLSQTTTTT
jgi:hypothetical protein